MTVFSRHIDSQNQIILPWRHYEMLSITVCRFPFSRGLGSSVRKRWIKLYIAQSEPSGRLKSGKGRRDVPGPPFPFLSSVPRAVCLFLRFRFVILFLFARPLPPSLQGSLVSGYFAVKTTTPPSPAGTTPVIRPRSVSRQIRKGSHSPLCFISVLSPFSYRFFLGGPLSVRGFNFKGIGPRSGGKIQVGVLKLELSLFAPPRSLTIPSTNSCLFSHTPRIILPTKHVSRDCTVFIMVMFTWNSFSSGPSCVFVQLCVIWTFFLVWLFYFQDDSLGADTYWAAGLHLYTPLPFRPGRGGLGDRIKTHLFLNSGNLISLNTSMLWILLSRSVCSVMFVIV